jgi:hypothetical protein
MDDHIAPPGTAQGRDSVLDQELQRVTAVGGVGEIRKSQRLPIHISRDQHRPPEVVEAEPGQAPTQDSERKGQLDEHAPNPGVEPEPDEDEAHRQRCHDLRIAEQQT